MATWYSRAVPVVWAALRALPPDATDAAIRRALRDAYPFGERRYWPYKVWLRACRDVCRDWARLTSRAPLHRLSRVVSPSSPALQGELDV